MRRLVLVAAICGCTPPAATVGAWTSDGSSASSDPSTHGDAAETTTADASSSTSTSTSASTSSESTTESTAGPPPWIATAGGTPPQLRAIDLDGGEVVDVCELAGVVEPDALAFLPDGRLVGTHAGSAALWTADPCDCAVTLVPALDPMLALHAMAERDDPEPTIVGIDTARTGMFAVPLEPPAVQLLAELANASAITAIAAVPGSDDVYALALGDGLHLQRIDPTGAVASDLPLAIPDDASGLTRMPDDDTLLACDGDGTLWRIDTSDGASSPLAVALPGACRTLATPPGPIDCIDALLGT